ncbi:alpha/beta hydrolase fold [Seinonella peptonophila]|uniref:Alpha/beta hydrolase fold n=1 Tax=Seinonella peptonophila TaxID=112248 RepID=A0A1M4X9R9_9BACL|nr:alpha/beta fold hydrolase [Seinonella peptonophila]SHE89872.1 alpha/beta hydrolase fold [Seinonella peptonophila]
MKIHADVFHVTGAKLYYEVRGTGPVLLLIHGGASDANSFHFIVDQLAQTYTVVTYDRRGHYRSQIIDSTEEYEVSTHSHDAHLLLAHLTDQPVYVFGSSSGALIGLDFIIRHPEQVKMLIPHEPPLFQMLAEDDVKQASKMIQKLQTDYQQWGAAKAMNRFGQALGMGNEEEGMIESVPEFDGNAHYFITKEAIAALSYQCDLTTLKALSSSILPAGGKESRQYFPYICISLLAGFLETEVIDFPSNHVGYVMEPKRFVRKLEQTLGMYNIRLKKNLHSS